MKDNSIIFMGTAEISEVYFQSLIDLDMNLTSVFTQPPRKKNRGMKTQKTLIHQLADKYDIAVNIPENLNSQNVQNEIKKQKPNLIVVMGYGLKIPNSILAIPKYGCINIHVSLLPRWRGAAPIEHALLNGDSETGITIFKLVEKMDAGPIISKKKILINNIINKKDLTEKLNAIGVKLLEKTIEDIFSKKIIFEKQNEKKSNYAHKIISIMRKINFNKDVIDISNQIRAFAPNPAAWFIYKKERIKIIQSRYELGYYDITKILNDQFHIGCTNGKICPIIVQREGKKPMLLSDFLRGFNFDIGYEINE